MVEADQAPDIIFIQGRHIQDFQDGDAKIGKHPPDDFLRLLAVVPQSFAYGVLSTDTLLFQHVPKNISQSFSEIHQQLVGCMGSEPAKRFQQRI